MDMSSCVARRTRSKTLSKLLETLKKSSVKLVEDSVEDLQEVAEKKRVSRSRGSSPAPAKRRRRKRRIGDDDIEFVREVYVGGEDDNAGSASVSSTRLSSKSVEPRVSGFAVGDENFGDDVDSDAIEVESCEQKTSNLSGSDLGSSYSSKIISLDSDGEGSVEILGTDGEDDDDESETSDCKGEHSDSSYQESSEDSEDACSEDTAYSCSEDELVEVDAGNNNTGSRKNSGEKKRNRVKRNDLCRRNNSNLFHRLASSIWDKDKNVEEDEKSCTELEINHCCAKENPPHINPKRACDERRRINRSRMEREMDRSSEEDGKSYDEEEVNQCTVEDPPLLNPKFGWEEPKLVEKSDEEKELDTLWREMAFALTSNEIDSTSPAKNENVLGTRETPFLLCSQGKHDFVIDEEVGLKCYYCSYVAVEIRDISPAMEKCRADVVDNKRYSERKDGSLFNRFDFDVLSGSNSVASLNNTKGTVWECIPGVKDTLYSHQQEGFEFIWRNLTGTTNLEELRNWRVTERDGCGGCIISHSPGTGKTRLTIVFLQAYLELFPNSCPLIITPASMLLTWEEEFKKWNVNIPFFNISTPEFSGKESTWARSILEENGQHGHDKYSIRMVKLFSWCKKKSILGVSYNLYEKLTRENSVLDREPEKRNGLVFDEERQEIRKILLEKPQLLVLDEGHTPRNQRSRIWKALSGVKTRNRIILSGTPFQNNFQELSNVLCLTRPAYAETISSRLKGLGKWSMKRAKGKAYEQAGIKELRELMSPFVHVHNRSFLQESLPGLRESVVVLKPQYLQKKILDRIERSQNIFKLEHKLSAVSVHPSLYLGVDETKKEKLIINGELLKRKLERLRLEPSEGAKARFLVDFIRLSESVNERVLVFSQYLDILSLILELLQALFGWTEGTEVLHIVGNLELKERQRLINNFNDPDSEAKVLLASTKACSEGINLVGASRVVLLDVVWNPSVDRQAISRAYRLGQKRVVYTYHLVIGGTPECDKYYKQAEKHRISELVFSSYDENDKLKNTRLVSEDKILEEMVLHEKLADMFETIIYQPKESVLVEGLGSVAV